MITERVDPRTHRLPLEGGPALAPNPSCQLCPRSTALKPADVCRPAWEYPDPVNPSASAVVLAVFGLPPKSASAPLSQADRWALDILRPQWAGPVQFTHAVRCAGDVKVPPAHVEQCRAYLLGDVQRSKPQRILCFGPQASLSVAGKALPGHAISHTYAHLSDGTVVFFLPDPWTVWDNRFARQQFELDLAWALTATPSRPLPFDVHIVENEQDAEAASLSLQHDFGRADFDVETFGSFGDREFRVLTIAVSLDQTDAWVWDEARLGPLRMAEAMRPLTDLFLNADTVKAAQNAKFDANALWFGLGLDLKGRLDCSRLQRKLIQADADASLATMQFLVGRGGWKDEGHGQAEDAAVALRKAMLAAERSVQAQPVLPKVWPMAQGDDAVVAAAGVARGREPMAFAFAALDPDVRVRYCASDALSAGALVDHFKSAIRQDPALTMVWEQLTHGAQRAIIMMERNGVLVDRDAISHLRTHLQGRVAEAMLEMGQWGQFSPSSTLDVARVLFDELKLPCKAKTAKGARQVSADVLADLNHPCADAIIAWRTASSWSTRYADGMESAIKHDGRVHPSIMMDGTETGRPSCADPNLFNLPRPKTPEGRLVRNTVVAPDGWILLEVDQSQVELREAAALSGDQRMIELFASGQDFHLATAKLVAIHLGIDPTTLTKDSQLRDQAKTINFAVLYGTHPAAIAQQLSITTAEAEKLVKAILGQFNDLKLWIDRCLHRARQLGHTRTFWNGLPARYRRLWLIGLPDGDSRRDTAERSAWNTPIQGSASDITMSALGQMQDWIDTNDPAGQYVRLILTVYDSILLEVREEKLAEVAHVLKLICERQPCGPVPLVADAKTGYAWGSMKDYVVP